MAVRSSRPGGGANGTPWRYDFAAGDTFDLLLERMIDWDGQGIIATIVPADGASIGVIHSLDTDMATSDEVEGSPFEEKDTIHINVAFQRARITATGGGGSIVYLLPGNDPRGFQLVE